MIILVATKNVDKFNTTVGIFTKLGLNKFTYKNLLDYKIIGENEEIGSLRERAQGKVEFTLKTLKVNDINDEIKLIVGIDDGFYVPSSDLLTANSKELVDDILSGKILDKGEIIEEVRSYAIYNTSTEKYHYYESRLPLIYLGNDEGIKREEGKNPLKHVLSFQSELQPIGGHTQEEIDKEILKYIEADFKNVLIKAITL